MKRRLSRGSCRVDRLYLRRDGVTHHAAELREQRAHLEGCESFFVGAQVEQFNRVRQRRGVDVFQIFDPVHRSGPFVPSHVLRFGQARVLGGRCRAPRA